MAAVKQNSMALRHVRNKTEEICLAAVRQDGWALEYVKNQTDEICLTEHSMKQVSYLGYKGIQSGSCYPTVQN